jgi:hypothetical protein
MDGVVTTAESRITQFWEAIPIPILIILVLLFWWWSEIPAIEGALFPVYRDPVITVTHPYNGEYQEVTLVANKVRGCTYVTGSLDVFWLAPSGHRQRLLAYPTLVTKPADMPTSLNRPTGINEFSYRVRSVVPPSEWEVMVQHKCHGSPFWSTRTRLWPR